MLTWNILQLYSSANFAKSQLLLIKDFHARTLCGFNLAEEVLNGELVLPFRYKEGNGVLVNLGVTNSLSELILDSYERLVSKPLNSLFAKNHTYAKIYHILTSEGDSTAWLTDCIMIEATKAFLDINCMTQVSKVCVASMLDEVSLQVLQNFGEDIKVYLDAEIIIIYRNVSSFLFYEFVLQVLIFFLIISFQKICISQSLSLIKLVAVL